MPASQGILPVPAPKLAACGGRVFQRMGMCFWSKRRSGCVYMGFATGWPGATSFNVSHLEIVTVAGLVSRL